MNSGLVRAQAFDFELTSSEVQFPGLTLTLAWARTCTRTQEGPPVPLGMSLWPSALALIHVMTQKSFPWAHTRVLEVGCGVGAAGVAAARLGARVTCTDACVDMAPLVHHNGAANRANMVFEPLAFEHLPSSRHAATVDLLLAADVLYEPALATAFLDGALPCLAPGGRLLVADPQRGTSARWKQRCEARGCSVATRVVRVSEASIPGAGLVLQAHAREEVHCGVHEVTRSGGMCFCV